MYVMLVKLLLEQKQNVNEGDCVKNMKNGLHHTQLCHLSASFPFGDEPEMKMN